MSTRRVETIQSLRRNVTREQAEIELGTRISRFFRGPLRALAEVFVPYRLFRLTASNGPARTTERLLAMDAACGELDPYGFVSLPGDDVLCALQTANVVPEAIDENHLGLLATDRLRRLVFSHGFFRVRTVDIAAIPVLRFHVPYWLGFSGWESEAHLTALDAVRRRVEGPKVRELFRRWLRHERLPGPC